MFHHTIQASSANQSETYPFIGAAHHKGADIRVKRAAETTTTRAKNVALGTVYIVLIVVGVVLLGVGGYCKLS